MSIRPNTTAGALACAALSLAAASAARAQMTTSSPPRPAGDTSAASRASAKLQAMADSVARGEKSVTLDKVMITDRGIPTVKTTPMLRLTMPAIATVTQERIQTTINVVDAEDAVKYLPSVFLRKRNNGDTQATMATRVWGTSSSARSLIVADGIPISAFVANNNTIGGPRWGLVSPEEISRVDMMYGPYSAAYAGNSMGAVMEITTRMPDRLEANLGHTQTMQRFDLYGTRDTYSTAQTSGHAGNRFGKLSFWLGGNYANSFSQPLSYVTSASFPNGTTGGFPERNKTGAAANILGASGLLHTKMSNAKVKLAYDITPTVRAAYTFGYWANDGMSGATPYVTRGGEPTFAGQAGFASGSYDLVQRQSAHNLAIRTDTKKDWDVEAAITRYSFDKDQQRTPTSASTTDASFGAAGRVAVLDGTGWTTAGLKGSWHKGGLAAAHVVSFGAHYDHYRLFNPTYNTAEWRSGDYGTVFTEGDGRTETKALWAQDAWTITPKLRLTVGGRYEWFRGYDGFNVNGAKTVVQPEVSAAKFSPKGVLAFYPTDTWTITASAAKAYRFATAAELYQLVSTGTTFTSPDPNLKPDAVLATEVRALKRWSHATAQLALFQDDVHDAIISQFLPLLPNSPTLYSYLANVDHVRARGAELVLGSQDLLVKRLDFNGSVTYLNARTLEISGRASANAPAGSAVGKFLPNTPKWRWTALTSYRPFDKLSLSLAGRYSSKLYTTLDNTDVRWNTYQGFTQWFVADAKANLAVDRHWTVSLGVDNLNNRKYFLFHPFPQRTFVASAKVGL